MAVCRPCIGLPCVNPDDLAAGIDGAIYSALDYSFIVQCPPNCVCQSGLFPQTISILASVIPPVIPPILEPGAAIILRLQGCTSLITRTLSSGSSQSEIAAAAQSMQAEWAGQEALCRALSEPGVNCAQASGLIDVCNDEFTFTCYNGDLITVPARTRCQKLDVTGMTIAEQQAAITQIKNNLMQVSRQESCPGFGVVCSIVMSSNPNPGQFQVSVWMTNVAADSRDLTAFQFCFNQPPLICFPPSPPTPPTSIAGSTGPIAWSGIVSASSHAFAIYWNGLRIFHVDSPSNDTHYDVFVTVGCEDA